MRQNYRKMQCEVGKGKRPRGDRERECKNARVRLLLSIQKIELQNMPELLGSIPVSIVWRKVKVMD